MLKTVCLFLKCLTPTASLNLYNPVLWHHKKLQLYLFLKCPHTTSSTLPEFKHFHAHWMSDASQKKKKKKRKTFKHLGRLRSLCIWMCWWTNWPHVSELACSWWWLSRLSSAHSTRLCQSPASECGCISSFAFDTFDTTELNKGTLKVVNMVRFLILVALKKYSHV